MKNLTGKPATVIAAAIALFALTCFSSCKKSYTAPDYQTNHQSFTVVNLVSTDASVSAQRNDPHLLNGWGLAFSPTGTAWISSLGDHTSLIYSAAGAQVLAPVTIPSHNGPTGGLPTGQVFNSSTGFKLSNGNPAKFIFAGIDGVISGWNSGGAAVTMVDRNGTAVYTGLAMGVTTDTLLYAADFNSHRIDVFDRNMALQPISFSDPSIAEGYSPFNIQNIGGFLYVTYAQPDPVTHTEMKAPGLGYVDVFSTTGTLVKRLVTGGALNAPWGITQAPDGWIGGTTGIILVGNLGDGHINAYDASGNYMGVLQSNGATLTIDGLWALSFAPSAAAAVNPNFLFFTAGPAGETKGLFGYVSN